MKEQYRMPSLEVIRFDCEDIITTSGFTPDDNETDIILWL